MAQRAGRYYTYHFTVRAKEGECKKAKGAAQKLAFKRVRWRVIEMNSNSTTSG